MTHRRCANYNTRACASSESLFSLIVCCVCVFFTLTDREKKGKLIQNLKLEAGLGDDIMAVPSVRCAQKRPFTAVLRGDKLHLSVAYALGGEQPRVLRLSKTTKGLAT